MCAPMTAGSIDTWAVPRLSENFGRRLMSAYLQLLRAGEHTLGLDRDPAPDSRYQA